MGLLHGCVQDAVFRPHNEATIRCLTRQGVEVRVPRTQGCCGALHAHAGEPERARALARATIAAFEAAGASRPSWSTPPGCGAHMKAYGHLLRGTTRRGPARAAAFARKVVDVTEFLARAPLAGAARPAPAPGDLSRPVSPGARAAGPERAPRALLRAVPGLELVDLAEAEMCCGSAGIYNLTEPVMAKRLLDRKMAHVEATGATTVVTANPGCILQLAAGLRARGRDAEVLHVVEVLDRAYAAAERARP